MPLWSGAAQELSHTSPPLSSFSHHHSSSSMRSTLSSSLRPFRSLSFYSRTHHYHHHHHQKTLRVFPLFFSHSHPLLPLSPISTPSSSSFASNSAAAAAASTPFTQPLEIWELNEEENFHFDVDVDEAANDSKNFRTPPVIEVKELDEFPEQWRRSKIAWLCKELPAHKPGTLIRLLNAQRKWMNLDNAMYIAVHFMRVRENETAFRVYKWMQQRHWFRFDFDFATRLADYMGKERKFSRCREIFDAIINQGRVPSESTFHILIVAYLSSPAEGYVEEACSIYNRMIQFGGYQPRLSLHNSLFRALVSKPGGSSKYFLKQAEFIFHNLVTTGFEIHKDIYAGMIWLHSYQDKIDTERLAALRKEMQQVGIEEGRDVLVSILRAYSKEGDVEEVDRTWIKLLKSDSSPPSQAFVYRMEVYAKVNESLKSLSIFREMQDMGSTSVVAYHKIIEVMTKAQKVDIAETLMEEFMKSSLKPLMPSFVDLMTMFSGLSLHDKLEATFFKCLENCRPNRTIYNIYLDSLIKTGSHGKASDIFNQMLSNGAIGVNSRSCNTILRGYLDTENFVEAEKIYDLMCQKKYDIEPLLMEKLDYVLSLTRKAIKKPVSLKLSKEQREILIGLLLGGLQIQSDEERKNHAIHFEFNESSSVHAVLKRHIHDQYHEWLTSFSRPSDVDEDIPHRFSTIAHPCFDFYADQFWPKGRRGIPNLIHRWLSPRVLAYWYMYGGHKTPSGDILLKLKGADREDVEKIVKTLKAKSLDCSVKRKGRVFWIGFLQNNSVWFWKVVEIEILEDLRDLLRVATRASEKEVSDDQHINFESESDSDDNSGW